MTKIDPVSFKTLCFQHVIEKKIGLAKGRAPPVTSLQPEVV
jgi:hypothetical protein